MDELKKFTLFDDSVLVTVISAKGLVSKALKLHSTSPTATAALGRTLIVAAFMSASLKGKDERLSITVNGGGELGRIIVAADSGAKVRGYVENPSFDLPPKNGKLDVGGAVGVNGYISVIKDLGLKEPYTGKTALVNGEIGSDFAYYFTASEQQPSAVAVGVLVNKTGVKSAGGIFIQPLPNCSEYVITALEDITRNFNNVSSLFSTMTTDEIIEKYFGQFDIHMLEGCIPKYVCKCNRTRLARVVMSLGEKDSREILADVGNIELQCHFCNKKYVFTESDVNALFSKSSRS